MNLQNDVTITNYSYLLCTHLRDVPPHVYVLYVRPQAHPSTHIFI